MDPLLLRFLERITAVLIGGIAIYLGFRLFLAVPVQQESSGQVKLPWNIGITLTRVGPGIFFALFGILAVSIALLHPLSIQTRPFATSSDRQADGKVNEVRYVDVPLAADTVQERADARALLRRDMAVLNTLPRVLKEDLSAPDRADIERGLRRVKLALLRPVWGTPNEGFGDYALFARWVEAGAEGAPPAGMEGVLALYRYGAPPTP